jgi:Ca2+-binding EF-hand superfamily protein
VVRGELKKTARAISSRKLKALWCVLDVDNDNQIDMKEFARFIKRGEKREKLQARQLGKGAAELGSFNQVSINQAVASTPTRTMRVQLQKDGLKLPDERELHRLSRNFNRWLEEKRYRENKDKSHSFYNLFKELDADDSGVITFDELTTVVRDALRKKESVLPNETLQGLWCVLDADDSDAIQVDEFATFIKGDIASLLKGNSRRARSAGPATRRRIQGHSTGLPYGFDVHECIRRKDQEKAIQAAQKRACWARQIERERQKAATREVYRARSIAVLKEEERFKRCMLSEMNLRIVRSPIPARGSSAGRLGANRTLPLYQSERIIERMEKDRWAYGEWWPTAPIIPAHPSSTLVDTLCVAPPYRSVQVIFTSLTSQQAQCLCVWCTGDVRKIYSPHLRNVSALHQKGFVWLHLLQALSAL